MKFRFLITVIILFIVNENVYASVKSKKNFNFIKISGTISNVHHSLFRNSEIDDDYSVLIHLIIKEKNCIDKNIFGFGKIAVDLSLTDKDNPVSYISYFGLSLKNYGNISYGRNYNILYDTLSWTNVDSFSNRKFIISKNFSLNSFSNSLTYRNESLFKHLQFSFQYQKGNKYDNKKYNSLEKIVNNYQKNKYGTSIIYNLNHKISLGMSFIKDFFIEKNFFEILNKNNDSTFTKNFNNLIYSIGFKYVKTKNLYFSALYTKKIKNSRNVLYDVFKEKISISELAIKYKFSKSLHTFLNYLLEKTNCLFNSNKKNLYSYIEFGATYIFNERILSFLNFQIQIPKKNKIDFSWNKSILIGITYQF